MCCSIQIDHIDLKFHPKAVSNITAEDLEALFYKQDVGETQVRVWVPNSALLFQ